MTISEIIQELKQAARGLHECNNQKKCLISSSAPIVQNLKGDEVSIELLAGMIFFCYEELIILRNDGFLISFPHEQKDSSPKEFQGFIADGLTCYSESHDPLLGAWLFIAQTAGKDNKSIASLMHIITAIGGIKTVKEIKKTLPPWSIT